MRVGLVATVFVMALVGMPALAQQNIRPGQTVEGDLSDGDDRLDSGEFTDVYEFEGQSGQTVRVTLRTGDFDAYLIVNGPDGFNAQNDDVGEGDTNAGLTVRLPADGPYQVFATTFQVGETGPYTFSLSVDGAGRNRGRPEGAPRGQTPQGSSPSQPSGVAARFLEAHNAERRLAGAPPLAWDTRLEQDARAWARKLVDSGQFDHEGGQDGENLWGGSGRVYTPEEAVQAWIDEKRFYRPGVFPDVRRPGAPQTEEVGHYTQLIWRTTTHVGCAMETRGNSSIVSCRYSPGGNMIGERP